MSYNDDKRELLKLKQGLIEESESEIVNSEKTVIEKPKGKAAIANYFYHNKFFIIIAAFFIVAGGFMVLDFVTREKEDMRFLTIANSNAGTSALSYSFEIEKAVEFYTPDFDNNGYVHAANYYLNVNPENANPDAYYANRGKLMAEVQDGTARLFIADKEAFEMFGDEIDYKDFFIDLAARYPNDANVTDSYFYKVAGTGFAEKAGVTGDVVYIAVRLGDSNDKIAENLRRALIVLDAITGTRRP